MSSRNRLELFEPENRTVRKARQRRERHQVHTELSAYRGSVDSAVEDVDVTVVRPPSHHHHPDAWRPKRRRVWKLPFWKRRNNVRATRNQYARRAAVGD